MLRSILLVVAVLFTTSPLLRTLLCTFSIDLVLVEEGPLVLFQPDYLVGFEEEHLLPRVSHELEEG